MLHLNCNQPKQKTSTCVLPYVKHREIFCFVIVCHLHRFIQCVRLFCLFSVRSCTHCTLTAPNIIHYFRQKICNDVFQSVRSVCNSSRCSPKIAGRLSCKKSVNICANLVTVQSLRNFDSFFSLFLCLCFSLPPVNSLQVVESKIKNLKNDQISLSLGVGGNL